ncbi:hypothetical protein Maq22A_2p42640 (plasmid) [Methylobacterium aquaticum]|uniref:Uncharacterized protein n=1 Tax=Methylobacterium aquaticum TaxID=270351 RepID=A0A1Y0ZCS4_9HYPH|nr:hypothetical protein Maq22A_2p42640 [Methylobacterium aquaticum]
MVDVVPSRSPEHPSLIWTTLRVSSFPREEVSVRPLTLKPAVRANHRSPFQRRFPQRLPTA